MNVPEVLFNFKLSPFPPQPGEWCWYERDGRTQVFLTCYCGLLMWLPDNVYQVSKDGRVLTRRARGFGPHSGRGCRTKGVYHLVGYENHQPLQ